ncbi:receptor-type tyrosine-protein phosphatase zeta-like [Anneissia japonica]|uniref:receptor-type tyrosine-protein phosphatase zeta-like n=1 Tax=Anneissia japonica TaxID=1529436 RepID=UPI001425B403|nr:receptor-type tyrosine-protein phosphatase zeta-like [Anneissia japonica]
MYGKILFFGFILIKGIHSLKSENVTQFIGANAFLPCTASTNILPAEVSSVEWVRVNITGKDVVIIDSQFIEMGKYFIVSHDQSKLKVHEVVLSDIGTYACMVYGDVEEDNSTTTISNTTYVNLIVKDPEPPGKPQEIANLGTSTSIQVMWAPGNGRDVIDGFIVEIRKKDDSQWKRISSEPQGPSAIMANATGLEPYTEYVVRVTALFNNYSKVSPVSDPIRTKAGKPLSSPEILQAQVINATSANVTWLAPDDDIRGVIVGYRVQFIYFDSSSRVLNTKDVSSNETITVLEDLLPATEYNISVAVKNDAVGASAFGPYSNALSITTHEAIPGKPNKVEVVRRFTRKFVCVILPVDRPNGRIIGYELYYRKLGQTKWNPIISDAMVINLENLDPFQQYELTAAVRNSVGLGEKGEITIDRTDTGFPSQPKDVKVQLIGQTFLITWDRPEIFYPNYTSYEVKLHPNTYQTNGVLVSEVFHEYYTGTIEKDMTTDLSYTVIITPTTESATEPSKKYDGPESTPVTFTVSRPEATPNPSPTMGTTPPLTGEIGNGSDSNVGLAVGLIFVFLFIIVVIVVLGIYYMHRLADHAQRKIMKVIDRIRRNDQSDQHKGSNGPRISVFEDPVDGCIVDLLGKRKSKEDPEEPPVPIEKFAEHVKKNHANSDSGFAEEFEEIQSCVKSDYSATASTDPACKSKNRYTNIVAYDHSRVKLQVIGDKPCSDYINGNYIDGFNKKNAFIATQGPLKTTVEDFWRMIWEQNSYTIIMITNLMEKGRRKCDKYWPIEGSAEKYGDFEVTCYMEDEMASFTIRNFVLKNTKMKKGKNNDRPITQYHYTDWPDHGVPNYPLPVYTFIKKSVKANPVDAGPMVVHCSAEQYCFIHDVLLDALRLEHSEVPIKGIREYIEKIRTPIENIRRSILDQHFELLHTHKFREYDFVKAHKEVNLKKNRRPDVLPVERCRVTMSARAGEEGSDYINATYFPGYRKINEFIVTQFPMENTISDFWRMIWDTNSPTIVMISSKDDQVKQNFYERIWDEDPEVVKMENKDYKKDKVDDEDGEGAAVTTPLNPTSCTGYNLHVPLALDEPVYWPTSKDNPLVFGNFKVSFVEEEHHLGYMTREFVLQSTQDEYELDVKQYRCTYWPESCSPLHTAFDLIKAVQDRSMINDGPITVHDKYGSTNAGTFCALSSLYQQMHNEESIDIYQIAKLYTLRRKGMFTDKVQYDTVHPPLL